MHITKQKQKRQCFYALKKTSKGKKDAYSLICIFMLFTCSLCFFVCKTKKTALTKIACLTFCAFYAFYVHKKHLSGGKSLVCILCLFVLFVLFVHVKSFCKKNKTALIPSFTLLLSWLFCMVHLNNI